MYSKKKQLNHLAAKQTKYSYTDLARIQRLSSQIHYEFACPIMICPLIATFGIAYLQFMFGQSFKKEVFFIVADKQFVFIVLLCLNKVNKILNGKNKSEILPKTVKLHQCSKE